MLLKCEISYLFVESFYNNIISTTDFNIDNNQKLFLNLFLKDHVTLKTEVMMLNSAWNDIL